MGTKASREELGDLGIVYARLFEFVKNGKRPAGLVVAGMQQLADGTFPAKGRFDRYVQYLLSLDAQLARLRGLDETVWNGRVSAAGWFDSLNTTSEHGQRADDLEFFYVSFGSVQEDVELHWKAIAANQRVAASNGGLYIETGPKNLRLHSTARKYKPGIHRVRINLVANWEPENGRTIVQARERVPVGCYTAQAETLGAYELHWELLQETDGENLPRPDIAGFEYRFPGNRNFAHCPYIGRVDDEFKLGAAGVRDVDRRWAAPVVLGV